MVWMGFQMMTATTINKGANAMTYYESAEGETISKARVKQELAKHGLLPGTEDYQACWDDLGDHDYYEAQKILDWLGY